MDFEFRGSTRHVAINWNFEIQLVSFRFCFEVKKNLTIYQSHNFMNLISKAILIYLSTKTRKGESNSWHSIIWYLFFDRVCSETQIDRRIGKLMFTKPSVLPTQDLQIKTTVVVWLAETFYFDGNHYDMKVCSEQQWFRNWNVEESMKWIST